MPLQLKETAGLRGTKGDEVIQSLARLLEKVHRLEVGKYAARECASEELGEHIALVEAQCALLGEQLRYARRVLAFSTNLRSTPDISPDAALPKSCTHDDDEVFIGSDAKERAPRDATPKVPKALVKRPNKTRRARSTPAGQHVPALSRQLHQQCRLTVADVPFILTKSTTSSHSLPANLQNLVSLLKKARPQGSHTAVGESGGSAHRQLCVVGSVGLPRSSSDPDLASQPHAAGLVHLMLQGEQLLEQLSKTPVPGTRHSLKCQCRRLISRIQAKMSETGSSGGTKAGPQKKGTSKPRSASTSSHGGGPFNRVIMRELRRIQDHLEEKI